METLASHFSADTPIWFSLCISPSWHHKQQKFPPYAVLCHSKQQRKAFSNISDHDKLPWKCLCPGQEESRFTAEQAGSSSWHYLQAGWESEPYWKAIRDFFPPSSSLSPSRLKQVKAGPLHLLPSLCRSLRAPPGRLVLYHYNHLFCSLHTHTLLLWRGRTGHILFKLCHFVFIWAHEAGHIPPHGRKQTDTQTRMHYRNGNLTGY